MWLPDEVIFEQIVIHLPLTDVVNCLCVSKQWKVSLSTNSFWRSYTFHHFDLSDEEEPSGNLISWSSNIWACYWDFEDESSRYVFETPPGRWKSTGIIHPASFDVYNTDSIPRYKDFLKCVLILKKMGHGSLVEHHLYCRALANESGGTVNVEVCLFPWQQDNLPDDKDLARIFTFNDEMITHHASLARTVDKVLEIRDGLSLGKEIVSHDSNAGTADFFRWLRKIFVPALYIYVGLEKMNPVPYFILTRPAPGWVGGFITWVTCT